MGDWQNEDEIKAELRTLTKELRRLREELRGMVTPPKPGPSRAFLHRQSWPAPPRDEPVEKAADKPGKPTGLHQKK
jgi:hypothetical protein